jgi:undecaprenyl diphosphate synthase
MTNTEYNIQHLAIIMDGNRRWATEKGLPKIMGHTEGAKNLKKIAKAVKKHGITHLTLYALSTENLKRSEKELKHLFSLFGKLTDYIGDFLDEGASLRLIGDLSLIPQKTREKLLDVVEKTKENTSFIMTLAVAYGGRDELVRATRHITEAGIKSADITEDTLEQYLDTGAYPDVELIIRTGGASRLSNFLLWKAAYAELYFTDTFWPAFSEADLSDALDWFAAQKRNFGK